MLTPLRPRIAQCSIGLVSIMTPAARVWLLLAATLAARLMVSAAHGQEPRDSEPPSRRSPLEIKRPILGHSPDADAVLAQLQVFPRDNAWNADISRWPRHPDSDRLVASVGVDKPLRYNPDMAFVLVPPNQPRVALRSVEYADESDQGPFPIPDELPIEGWPASYERDERLRSLTLDEVQRDKLNLGGDRHAIVVDPSARKLYEFFNMRRTADGWRCSQASIFDLGSNQLRPAGWTSADAAGLPIFPAIVRFDELERGVISHALRVTVRRSRRAYVHPATHYASRLTDPNLPRMGERFRLRASFDIKPFSPPVRVILAALQKHGMLVADNGIEWAISVAPDPRIPELHEELRRIKGRDFEVVQAP